MKDNYFSKYGDFVAHQDIYKDMKKKTKHISIRLTSEQYKKLNDILKVEGLTKSELVRLALVQYESK